ncbi:2,4-dienoyl-CoA reductase-like NADH-dependent reductase (Old Yellow Enzyme family) [Geodermatophilus tzadiensis]|uniref:2,4-dienoyl-CoA reductase-like NADH-dependent reductase (Old Yellow Enzyme family) n=1 Tax=Geodermatophilus tzadiensis TaxID=1137988 RepID=A0A2T0T697_9ACTN|nr:NADH:flavin oxidoreductase/NADH oxidase [Geodermatophilus tzadiensis]PRY41178.1 2,4-dienoyl-CoA reductase-like NADH-dependent reductase (Old Yellow Enzyme family) [Geodermatophilus tzadiensis]
MTGSTPETPALLTPLTVRGVTLPNRLVVAPMCQYSVSDGLVGDYHLVHLGRFALGGFGLVLVEATAVTPQGRISHGDVGLWSDGHVPGLARVADFLRAHGAVAGIQLAHAGAKASSQRPWEGGAAVTAGNARPGEQPWPTVSASAVPAGPGWPVPHELTVAELGEVRDAFVAATRRALAAGFDVVEVHAAHGYLLHQFLSPLSNRRTDGYGGSREARMRFPLEVVAAVRAEWPEDRPLFVRVSAVDGSDGGITLEDTVALAAELRARGVDVVDVSGGGLGGWQHPLGYGYQVPFAARLRAGADVATMAVGLIVDPRQAEAVVAGGLADLVAVAREAQDDPNFAVHAARELTGRYDAYPVQAGPRLGRRGEFLGTLGPWTGPGPVQVAERAR